VPDICGGNVISGASRRPVMLIIMDGYGCREELDGNAVAAANTPVLDNLVARYPHGLLAASGLDVGLPEGQMGNSEVGHLNLGAGKVVYQDLTRISRSVEDGSFFETPALVDACRHVVSSGSTLHVMGLIGFGGVHSHQSHLEAVIELARRNGVRNLAIHAFTDGRDSMPSDALEAMSRLEATLRSAGIGRVATVSGRYYAMDRDRRWDRTELAYRAITAGEGEVAGTAEQAINQSYARGVTDEFILPTVVDGAPVVSDGDAVVFFNFRTDRPRQLVRAFVDLDFTEFPVKRFENLYFVTMTQYARDLPVHVAFGTDDVEMPLGLVVSQAGLTQLHAAETEKYAHVTFFFNGGREEPFPGEQRILIPSPRHVGTYDKIPQMSADGVTDAVIEAMSRTDFGFMLVNFANADMVGHTGDMQAATRAVETVDHDVGRLVEAVRAKGGAVLVTADHGNAEQMIDPQTGGPFTSHTIDSPVPVVLVPPDGADRFDACTIRLGGRLADVAPTVLDLMGIDQPEQMEGRTLIETSG
jgi:2,3-bisphosphoglycerate-independent phosphoglycerate mutase